MKGDLTVTMIHDLREAFPPAPILCVHPTDWVRLSAMLPSGALAGMIHEDRFVPPGKAYYMDGSSITVYDLR